jgi:glycosyltransferase involved in cell wall biosynthesis
MQVIQVIHGIHNLSAGPTHSVARLTDELCALGERASILTLGRTPAEWRYRAPVKIHRGVLASRVGVSLSLAREIQRLLHLGCVLHDHGIWRATNLFPLLAPREAPSRIVCSPRGTLSPWSMQYKLPTKRPFWRLLQQPALRRCHCFHATSWGEYEAIRGQGFTAPVAVIPNGVDIPDLDPDLKRARRVVFLGRLDPVKGLDILLPAWTAIAHEFTDWELVIAGPMVGEYADTLRKLARRLDAPRIEFIGQAHGEAKRALLSGASLFVLPSYSENFGLAVAEALAHGTPAITTTGTPWAEVMSRRCGWYITPSEDALREALRDAMSQPASALREMGQRGRDWMRRDYAWPAVAWQMKETYEWLMRGGIRPSWIVT